MSNKLVQRLQRTRDSVYALSDKFGMIGHCRAIFRHRINRTDYEVLPRPRLLEPSSRQLYKLSTLVEVNRDDKMLMGVSRFGLENDRDDLDYIYNGAICYLDGKPYSILWVDKNRSHDYEMLVRPERAR